MMNHRFSHLLLVMIGLACIALPVRAAVPVGVEGQMTVRLPAGITAAPVAPQADVIVRIAQVKTIDDRQSEYDVRYTIMEKGKHDLRRYLQAADGHAAGSQIIADALEVEGTSVLPEDFNGRLISQTPMPLPGPVHYWRWMAVAGTLWAAVLIPILLIGRKKKLLTLAPNLEVLEPPVLTTLQKLRGLVSQVELGAPLTVEQQSHLESLLLAYWREKKNLTAQSISMERAMQELRLDPEVGQLLDQLEDWLHRPPTGPRKPEPREFLAVYGRRVS